jgi:3-phosphoshikimate 1-carboxyvinyltransferase
MSSTQQVRPAKRLRGRPEIPGDKSVSHRSLIFGALASGTTEIRRLLGSGDVNSTASCLRQLGVQITQEGPITRVIGKGGYRFDAPSSILDCGNSGTTIRLLMGVLAGQNFEARMTGDASLVKRPMKRVSEPLAQMGAEFKLTDGNFAPLTVIGKPLHGIDYNLKVSSAQVKTAILLAGLNAEGTTTIRGEIHSRDHTERMLNYFGVTVESTDSQVSIRGGQKLKGGAVLVPGDPSTAAFWLGAACIVPDSRIEMENISLNPSRIGFARALQRMGAKIELEETLHDPEPMGIQAASSSGLRGIHIVPEEVPSLIDELPLLAVLATQAHGTTLVEGAEELRVKESDRIEAVAKNLRAMGAKIEVRPDGFVVEGPQILKGAQIDSFHDHRIAMAFSIAGLVAQGETTILHPECVGISYPAFFDTLRELSG